MTRKHYRTKSFIYSAKVLARILSQSPGAFVDPSKVMSAMHMEAFKEQKTDELRTDIGYLVYALQRNPAESYKLIGGKLERQQSGGKKSKIIGYRFTKGTAAPEPKKIDPLLASGQSVLNELQKARMELTQALGRIRNLENALETISEEQRRLFAGEGDKERDDQ